GVCPQLHARRARPAPRLLPLASGQEISRGPGEGADRHDDPGADRHPAPAGRSDEEDGPRARSPGAESAVVLAPLPLSLPPRPPKGGEGRGEAALLPSPAL